jgi:Fe-S-cluster containining protein
MSALPCGACKADCCGPVVLSLNRLAIIEKHIASMSEEQRSILASQERDGLTCSFVDMRDYSCSVYPVRPAQCELYGRTIGMECPHHKALVNIVTQDTAMMRISLDLDSGPAILSTEYKWM